MTRKTKEAYVGLFNYIETHVCNLNPSAFMLDYEQASRQAIRQVYPESAVSGCYFHFTQAARKYANGIKTLFALINANPEMSRVYHKLLVLPLLPHYLINDAFYHLESQSKDFGGLFQEFLRYFANQWIVKVCIYLNKKKRKTFY